MLGQNTALDKHHQAFSRQQPDLGDPRPPNSLPTHRFEAKVSL